MLEKLRAKPDHIKQRIAWVFAVGIFLIILSVWVSSWDARWREKEAKEKVLSPLAGFAAVFNGIVGDVKTVFSSSVSSAPDENPMASSTPKAPPRLDATVLEAVLIAETPGAKAPQDDFDISGIVIVDSSVVATSTKENK